MKFLVYLIGFLILIAGLAWAASTLGVPQLYVAIGAVILLGIGIISAVSNTHSRAVSDGANVTVVKTDDRL